jgi:hypothetical protein
LSNSSRQRGTNRNTAKKTATRSSNVKAGVRVGPSLYAFDNVVDSIALQESSLAGLLDLEGQKIQAVADMNFLTEEDRFNALMLVNESVNMMVCCVTRMEGFLASKLTTCYNAKTMLGFCADSEEEDDENSAEEISGDPNDHLQSISVIDCTTGEPIEFAVFLLYKLDENEDPEQINSAELSGRESSAYMSATHGALRIVVNDSEQYLLRLVSAPDGYVLDSSIHTLSMNDGSAYVDGDKDGDVCLTQGTGSGTQCL